MNKPFFIVTFMLLLVLNGNSQSRLHKLIEHYYKVNPLKETFATFLNTLNSDLALVGKIEHKKSDSTGYYLRGKYKTFNPFDLKPGMVDMIFYEDWLEKGDTEEDTYFAYQITAYFPDTEQNRKQVIKEYEKMAHKMKRVYPDAHTETLNEQRGIERGEIQAFRNTKDAVTTAISSWQTLSKTKQLGLSMVVRLRKEGSRLAPLTEAVRPGKMQADIVAF